MLHRYSSWRKTFTIAVLTALAAPDAGRGEFRSPTAITGVTIVSGDGTTIESGTILMDDGRIQAWGVDVTVPPGAEVIDATGMVAYPGFISAHDHLGIADKERAEADRQRWEDENPDPKEAALAKTRDANRLGIRPQMRAFEHFEADSDALDKYRAIGLTTLLAAPRNGIFGGSSALVNLSDAPLRRKVLRTDVAQHASFEPGEPGQYPRSLLGIFAQFRQVLLDTAWSAERQRFYARHPNDSDRPASDPAIDALRPVLSGAVPVIFAANTQHEINRALNLASEFDLEITISGAKEAYKVIDRIKNQKVPLMVSLEFDEEPEYGKKKKGAKKRETPKPDDESEDAAESDDDAESKSEKSEKKVEGEESKDKQIYEPLKLRKERRRLWEEQVANVIRLHEAGVAFALSTRDFKKPSDFIKNLRLVIERGLPAEVALAALTRIPAEMFEMDGQIGRIAVGQLANVTVMSGPLEKDKSKVKYVFIDGRKHEIDAEAKDKDNGGAGQRGQRGRRAPAEDDETDESPQESDVGQTDAVEDETDPSDAVPEGEEAEDTSEDEKIGPVWDCEIEADRVPSTQTTGDVLVANGTVITVSGATLDRASILIQNGKITAIGSDVASPPGTPVIDASGRYVIPGMIDAHSHMAISGINEGTLSVTAEVRVGDLVNNDSVGIYRALAGGVTTTHAMHGSANPIGGQNVTFKLKYLRPVEDMILHDAPRTIKFALGENVKRSNSFRNRDERFPGSRMGVEAVIRDAFEKGRQYASEWERYRAQVTSGQEVPPVRRDLRLEAMSEILSGDLWIHSHCYRSDEILRLLDVVEDYGVRIAVLQHVLEGYRIVPEIARHGAGASTFSNFWAYKVEAYGAIPHNAAMMTRGGIVTTVNSDSPNTIRWMNQEAAKCIRWGALSENEALRLVTLNAAIQLGIDGRVGSIEVGMDGDLAIFNGHPLNSHSRNVMTLIEGVVYFEDVDATPATGAGPLDWNLDAGDPTADAPRGHYAIVGGTVHPVSGASIEGGTVLIRDDRIVAVGKNVDVPAGATIVNVNGQHVYPGLIDAGGNLGIREIDQVRATIDASDIATFAPELRTLSAVHPHSELIAIARSGGLTSQLAVPSGGMISGQSALIHLDGWTAPEMSVSDRVGLHLSVPSLPPNLTGEEKKNREKQHKEQMKRLEDFVGQAKRYAAAMGAAESGSAEPPDRDLRLEAMLPYVRGEKRVFLSASSYKAILDALEFAKKHELKPLVTGGLESWKLVDQLKENEVPVILNSVLSYPRDEFEAWDSIYRCAGVLDRAGVRWCFASGSAANAYDLGTEAGMAVAYGLDPDRAVYGMTLGAAHVLEVDDRLGSLDAGKIADVIVTTHPPTQTVAKVSHMFIAGRPVSLSSMHTHSYERFKNRPAPTLPPPRELGGPAVMTPAR